MKRTLILALLLASGTVAGCASMLARDPATGQTKEPREVDPGALAAAQATATTAGTIFGPVGAIVGTGIAGLFGTIAAAYAAHQKGKEKGYNEGSLDAGKPLASAAAGPK